MTPFFSIIIPSYNRASFIITTINSVLNQSFKSFEIILVDDGSTDNTNKVVKQAFGANSTVRYFYKENGERGAARNYGLKQSKGQYAVFLDSDDLMYSNYLQDLFYTIKENPDIDFFACKYELTEGLLKKRIPINDLAPGLYNYLVLLKGNIFACNFCLKINQIIIPFEEGREYASMEDWIFLIQNLKKKKILLINRLGVNMIDHQGRSMANNQKVLEARLRATDYLIKKEKFSVEEMKILKGYTYNFCAVHSYLDKNRSQSLRFYKKCVENLGFGLGELMTMSKFIVGRKIIESIPRRTVKTVERSQ